MQAVLNAFRHQRKELWPAGRISANGYAACSTPFGINGRNSAVPRGYGDGHGVLNAFRHQRKELASTGTRMQRQLGACSTPFGINGRNTWALPNAPSPVRCAQRLSASTEGTLDFGRVTKDVRRLCSTPFGINGRNHGLAAEITHCAMCSTPFGINGRNTVRPCGPGRLVVLNAFRHQRKEHAIRA